MRNHTQHDEAEHGGIDWNELQRQGIDPQSVIDLSSNVLFVEPSDEVRCAVAKAAISRYPDRHCGSLREALADRHGIDRERILVGNGCSELIHLVAATLLHTSDHVLVIGPTFSEYSRASRLANAVVHEVCAQSEVGFSVSTVDIALELRRVNYRMVWLCNPNNPTGQSIDASIIQQWIQTHPQTIFVVDESYIEFSNTTASLICDESPNHVVLRSMTKSYALAGVRLGYLVTSASQTVPLIARRIPWSVNEVAQSAGLAAIKSQGHYDNAMASMKFQRTRLINELQRRNYQPLASDTGFLMIPVRDASEFRDRMLSQGILVRDCRSFGIENHIRIAVGDAAATDRFLSVLDGQAPAIDSTPSPTALNVPVWQADFREQLYDLFRMRRDVRRFRLEAISPNLLAQWIDAACLAPSVGLSQPWRFVSVNEGAVRDQVIEEFEAQNCLAAAEYDSATRRHYQQLKLAGLSEAPEHLAVFVEPDPEQGHGLGRRTMPETVFYSVVAAIQNFWLAARCDGVGVGWVSIVRPERISKFLAVPAHWQLIAYLCVGYPLDPAAEIPELEQHGWQRRGQFKQQWIQS